MRVLVGIPVLYNGSVCLQAFKSIIEEADLLIVDNGAEQDVKEAINQMSSYNNGRIRVGLIRNEKNEYVTAAWNALLGAFLDSNCPHDQLVIMNSDLIMNPGWSKYLENNVWCIVNGGNYKIDTEVFEGIAGVFINFNKAMARLVYPIPKAIKIWYGDTWFEYKFRKYGYKMIVKAGLTGEHVHGGSITVRRLPEFQEIIQQDMIAWKEIEKTI